MKIHFDKNQMKFHRVVYDNTSQSSDNDATLSIVYLQIFFYSRRCLVISLLSHRFLFPQAE